MKIKSAKFITSVADYEKLPALIAPEIAVAGKSNVGKSSFINMLANINRLAKTSSTPGRTRLLNYFDINNGELTLVDLPGYGYAKVNDAEKEKWSELIEGYFAKSQNIVNVFVLVDVRHEPTALDRQIEQSTNSKTKKCDCKNFCCNSCKYLCHICTKQKWN